MKNPNDTTPTTVEPTTKKETVVQKLRDLSLEDLEVVTGGAAACDNNVGQNLM